MPESGSRGDSMPESKLRVHGWWGGDASLS
jgi:hypothetical protein